MSDKPESSPPEKTTCCVVGAGPAGMVLAYLLARHGVDVTLLESHGDFDRDFRGDTFHASSMDLMDALGLGAKMDAAIHAKVRKLSFTRTDGYEATMASFAGMPVRHPYVAVIPQAEYLDLMAAEAKAFPGFHLRLKTTAQELIEEDGAVKGVRYRHGEAHGELRADLVVAADGRGSRLRKAAGFELRTSAPPMDIVWFRLRHEPGDPELGVEVVIGTGEAGGDMLVIVDRGTEWQLGRVILKGSGKQLRDEGLEAMQARVRHLAPAFLKDRVARDLDDWKKVAVLAVQVGRVDTWYKPGLLLIGDAAHVMSPVGGVGINYAIQDAVAAFNHIANPLKHGCLRPAHLAAVQQRREWPTQVIQGFQTGVQKQIIQQALRGKDFKMPLVARLLANVPGLNRLPAKLLAYGVRSDHKPEPLPA